MTAIARVCETVSDALAGAGRVHNRVRMIGTARCRRRDAAITPAAAVAPGAACARNLDADFSSTSSPLTAVPETQGRRGAVPMSPNNKTNQSE